MDAGKKRVTRRADEFLIDFSRAIPPLSPGSLPFLPTTTRREDRLDRISSEFIRKKKKKARKRCTPAKLSQFYLASIAKERILEEGSQSGYVSRTNWPRFAGNPRGFLVLKRDAPHFFQSSRRVERGNSVRKKAIGRVATGPSAVKANCHPFGYLWVRSLPPKSPWEERNELFCTRAQA